MNDKVTTDAAAMVRIEGRVQGVGFRYFVYRQAKKYDLNGWVRNCSDGSVEACFEGTKHHVDEIVALCKKGPAGSTVKKIEVTTREPEGKYSTFQLRHGNN